MLLFFAAAFYWYLSTAGTFSVAGAENCPSYVLSGLTQTAYGFDGLLTLNGPPCHQDDIASLRLVVKYEAGDEPDLHHSSLISPDRWSSSPDERLHVLILDKPGKRYQVPTLLFPRPAASNSSTIPFEKSPHPLVLTYETDPFSFTVSRRSTHEVLFSTKSHPLIFRDKHLQIATQQSPHSNIYGLGESTDTFKINLEGNGTRRTMCQHIARSAIRARDAYGTPNGTNLYGTHPIFYDHRTSGTHGVFLLNSNGMDITLTKESIRYDVIGGVLDFYFLAGPSPVNVAAQYAALAGHPAMIPYWSLGFQQCRYGYSSMPSPSSCSEIFETDSPRVVVPSIDYVEVAEVIANYSQAGIPLETMWTDIDYMYKRRTFTLDPDYFPLERMQEIVKSLHENNQRYVMMIDPAIAYQPGDKGVFDRGMQADVFIKEKDGNLFQGVVWAGKLETPYVVTPSSFTRLTCWLFGAGVSVYPDWYHPNATEFWANEIVRFFDLTHGIDIDGIWIDMNEPANFALPCYYPCHNATLLSAAQALSSGNPPARSHPPPPKDVSLSLRKPHARRGLEDNAPYQIHNAAGDLAKGTIRPDLVHHNGLTEYDVHNLFGTHMSLITRQAMLRRRNKVRPQIITRSTFAGAGTYAAHWTGDNLSDWPHYLSSITEIMSFASLFQVPLVGADVCGFGSNTSEELCARWASLGAFYPFYRNHNEMGMTSQEFYRWKSVASSARNAIQIRYSLLDYFYTHMRRQSLTGEPAIKPLWFAYPLDTATFGIDKQFLFGDSILVSPVTEANSTRVEAYFPESNVRTMPSIRYTEFSSREIVEGSGITELKNIAIDQIPIHIKPGSIIPIRQVANKSQLAMTTTEVRKRCFEILVSPGRSGSATGWLYLDDGESLEPEAEEMGEMEMKYEKRVLTISGRLGSRMKDISTAVCQWTFSDVPNVERVKGIRVIDSDQLESGARLLPAHVDKHTRSAYAQGNWKLTPGMKVALLY
ncbi:hypothetical protein VP01_1397g1 [Puccinia sorghi]|uniref:Probable alpha/beta-glucosidase agdC n=1 Tax=Puccinia sorghi TaxID=27349 RepID=A0A0L6VL19_9BASI|nr:hypothetical protein VP01_1397g1 [Puccinia sorghi]